MKKVILLFTLMALSVNIVFAQNPMHQEQIEYQDVSVSAETVTTQPTLTIDDLSQLKNASFLTEQEYNDAVALLQSDPDRVTAGVLAILLGGIGVQHFYTGQTVRGILDICFCWTGIPALIGLVEGIIWLCEDDASFAERVADWKR